MILKYLNNIESFSCSIFVKFELFILFLWPSRTILDHFGQLQVTQLYPAIQDYLELSQAISGYLGLYLSTIWNNKLRLKLCQAQVQLNLSF